MAFSKIKAMLKDFFGKSEHDLEGHQFKKAFESISKAQLIDVRTPAEVTSGTIGKAINIDFMSRDFDAKIQKLEADKTYFVFCRSGTRSATAVRKMKQAGFTAYNLVGGINSWPR
ncbi:rhodanese-like domain-containing protein [Mucilaginibacter sp. L3T2-6]|uniref:rhodanese-like domain-containing protein n=1 Tax=Mucilaginibacter sp. L3T2-6 TaxID=3062491 RepID=UPI0026755F89|nr:rhodanese-like domain-containing protein [Mucilaginibacter sp. L3T2-6]MDO3643802.1 rhodanese-like domain-containing protein [Mucilaginibacter sp. L3T2-6]MDV6216253.1 rhodanese-like domain-containing protein [Mucilaginibacter sp. L3T2-6]